MIIEINGTDMRFSGFGEFTYLGLHSGKELCGIDLEYMSFSEEENEQIEAILKSRGTVTVSDPFAQRKYEATVDRKWSSGYRDGHPAKTYRFVVRELDQAKKFAQLQIEGETFTVLSNYEDGDDEDAIGVHTLLELSPEQFVKFHGLLRSGPIQVLREGIDAEPIQLRFGGLPIWSYHGEFSERSYKQIARFYRYDPDRPARKAVIASVQEMDAIATMVTALTSRFGALLELLESSGTITSEDASRIMQEQWRDLTDDKNLFMIRAERWKVVDAEEDFDPLE